MAMGPSPGYMVEVLEEIQKLPNELREKFDKLESLNKQVREAMQKFDGQTISVLTKMDGLSADEKKQALASVQKNFDKVKQCCDKKVKLTVGTHKLMDKRIRKLDECITRFQAEIEERKRQRNRIEARKAYEMFMETKRMNKLKVSDGDQTASSNGGDSTQNTNDFKTPAPPDTANPSKAGTSSSPNSSINTAPSNKSAIPGEPIYCLCERVSFGRMIGCDNSDCPIEWFHFDCVNIKTNLEGNWYCPICLKQCRRSKKNIN